MLIDWLQPCFTELTSGTVLQGVVLLLPMKSISPDVIPCWKDERLAEPSIRPSMDRRTNQPSPSSSASFKRISNRSALVSFGRSSSISVWLMSATLFERSTPIIDPACFD